MMKRMICCLLAVFLLLGMVGCAGKTEVDGTKPGETTGATEPADPTEGVTEPGVTDPTEEVTEPGAAGDVTEPEVTETPTQDATEAPTEGATEAPTQDATEAPSEETVEDPTEAPTEAPTEPEVTEATEAAPSEPEVTDPGEVELPAVPTVPATEAPVEPTVPATEAPTEAPTEPTSPATTEPAVTEPPATEPPATEPPATEHTHTYSSKVVKPTCEKKGYTLYTCDCGESYKDNYTKAGAHDYQAGEVVEATMWKEGYTTYTCSRCGDSYEGDKTDKIPQKEFERLVAEAVVKYINQYRVAQGDTEAQILPGLTQIAEDRAVELIDNFAHTSLRALYNSYQYGEYFDVSEWGEGYENYWDADAKEAIAKRGSSSSTAEELGRGFAEQFLNSAGHWAYVGDSKYPFIGIGIAYDSRGWGGYYWHCCVLQTAENYG